MTNEDFEKFLESIGGLKNGFYTDRPAIKSRGFFSIHNGWLRIVKELIEKLIELDWNKEICQVKEKFGGLRFYTNGLPEGGFEAIMEAENLSYNVCEDCGSSGELRKDLGWILTLCDEHYKQIKQNKI